MNIAGLFFNNEIRTGGHTRYLELMEGLAEKGNRVELLMNSALDYNERFFIRKNIKLPYRRGKHLSLSARFLYFMKRSLKKGTDFFMQADCLLVFGETHWKSARYLSRKYTLPLYFAFRSDPVEENRTYLRFEKLSLKERLRIHVQLLTDYLRGRQIARSSRRIFFQSEHDRTAFLKRYPRCASPDKTAVIRGDLRQARFRSDYRDVNKSQQLKKLLFVGTLGRRKGLEYLLRALALCADSCPYSLDVLAGNVENSSLPELCKELGIADRVHFHGRQNNPLEWMRTADLLIVPSLFDSYPNTILEALHTGLPLIASRCGGIPDMLESDELLFPPADAAELAARLEKLRDNNNYLKVRELCALRRSYFDFDWAEAWQNELKKA